MNGVVVQVNTSHGGIPKTPIEESFLTREGLQGDAFAHPGIHGGPRQAVLLITSEAIDELKQLGFPLYPGALGENLTTQGLDRRQMRPGQRYRVGDAIIELTKLRQPCNTLDIYGPGIQKAVFDEKAKSGDPSSPKWALAGFYAAVIHPGRINKGCPIMLLEQAA